MGLARVYTLSESPLTHHISPHSPPVSSTNPQHTDTILNLLAQQTHPMSSLYTNPFNTLHHSPESNPPPTITTNPSPSHPQSPAKATSSPAPPYADKDPPSHHPNKDAQPTSTSRPSPPTSYPSTPNTPPTPDDIHALLAEMGQVQDTMRTSISYLEAVATRAAQHTATEKESPRTALPTTTTTTTDTDTDTDTDTPRAKSTAWVVSLYHTPPPAPQENAKMKRLELANASLEQENVALRKEVEGLRLENRAVRGELRRNVMVQGLRWIGRDL
ncbi:hypothetical protein P171DRAFT_479166 [Karstenula rhodostoma CBS 690.94]|uniref:Uncharacterized protein n=1 Tax=Karstenula rhodostoma CBS 690.94 TaxID=1392251 RepID=A0A9P4Q0A7_9PLEO|nr:hypothetical protein P171DRAFT_479166 [Karstenula rhodostoma CBS 690.94]